VCMCTGPYKIKNGPSRIRFTSITSVASFYRRMAGADLGFRTKAPDSGIVRIRNVYLTIRSSLRVCGYVHQRVCMHTRKRRSMYRTSVADVRFTSSTANKYFANECLKFSPKHKGNIFLSNFLDGISFVT